MARFSWRNKTVLLTGGTGSFGRAFVNHLLSLPRPPVIRIFSRDEFKQYHMQQELASKARYLRFLLGDVRDKDRLRRAIHGVDVIVHAAALKHIPLGEYNPIEPILTNIIGSKNIVDAALDERVSRSLLISTDKAAYPINLYGATKLCAEKLFVQGNVYTGKDKCMFSAVRYGNVLGSRGSVISTFHEQKKNGLITITDKRMTRFWISLEQACQLVIDAIARMKGGETFIPKLPSVNVVDLARTIAPNSTLKIVGIRPGEKLHETLITEEESRRIEEHKHYFIIRPQFPFWEGRRSGKRGRPKKEFIYRSDLNDWQLTEKQLQKLLA